MLGKLLLFGWKDCPTWGRIRGEGCIMLLKISVKKKYISSEKTENYNSSEYILRKCHSVLHNRTQAVFVKTVHAFLKILN